jgi:oligopeptide/dipeptide ABC transporter ATP-binding protein
MEKRAPMLLEVKDVKTYFYTDEGVVKAVDGVSFSLERGQILGIVGESGCGKSMTALSIMRLVPSPGKIIGGEVIFNGRDLLRLGEKDIGKIRGNEISMIFQDPMTSLNPVFTIGDQIAEAIRLHGKVSGREAMRRTIELLEMVSIPQAYDRVRDYPHQFSGGMRQRVMIAMAISCEPDLLIADEPTTALDVTIQAQILELIQELQGRFNSAVILITHDLGVVAGLADNVLVMYAGKIVEYGDIDTIYYRSRHPYTWGLMNSIPHLGREGKGKLKSIRGSPPSLVCLPRGCSFSPRCEFAREVCFKVTPVLEKVAPGHFSACHRRREEGIFKMIVGK